MEPVSTDYVKVGKGVKQRSLSASTAHSPPLLPAQGLIEVRVVLGGPNASLPADVQLRLGFNGGAPGPATSVPVVAGTAVLAAVPVPDFKLWTIGQGNLFTLTVSDPSVLPTPPPYLAMTVLPCLPSSNRSRRWRRATR